MNITDDIIYVTNVDDVLVPLNIKNIALIYLEITRITFVRSDSTEISEITNLTTNKERKKMMKRISRIKCFFQTGDIFINLDRVDMDKTLETWGKYEINFSFSRSGRWELIMKDDLLPTNRDDISLDSDIFINLIKQAEKYFGKKFGTDPCPEKNGLIYTHDARIFDMKDILFITRAPEDCGTYPYETRFNIVFEGERYLQLNSEEITHVLDKPYMKQFIDPKMKLSSNQNHIEREIIVNLDKVDIRKTARKIQFCDVEFLRNNPVCFLTLKGNRRYISVRLSSDMVNAMREELKKKKRKRPRAREKQSLVPGGYLS